MKDCCNTNHNNYTKKCRRKDGKIFSLPRKFTKKQCQKTIKGFSMRSSCAPYKMCGGKKNIKQCIAKLFPDKKIKDNNVKGIVNFIQKDSNLVIKYKIKNLKDGYHGFHIHRCGDITKGCDSGCEHFNPYNKDHGGLNDENSHAGDLGNIYSKNGSAIGKIVTDKISINIDSINSIIGRMIIVHQDRDDLGKGDNNESKKTGNAGARLSCGIIGIKDGI
jgi:Cu-Zn family superoxide dismutase